MIIKKAKYKKVKVLQNKLIAEEVHGCDECRIEIKEYPNEYARLEITVFHSNDQSDHLHFCSWKCVLKHLSKIKTDYFVSLPFLYYDEPRQGKRGAKELINLLEELMVGICECGESIDTNNAQCVNANMCERCLGDAQ